MKKYIGTLINKQDELKNKEIINDVEYSKNIKKKYKENNLNEKDEKIKEENIIGEKNNE